MAADAMAHQHRGRDGLAFDQRTQIVDGLVDAIGAARSVRTAGAAPVVGDRPVFGPKSRRLVLPHFTGLNPGRCEYDGLSVTEILAIEAYVRCDFVLRHFISRFFVGAWSLGSLTYLRLLVVTAPALFGDDYRQIVEYMIRLSHALHPVSNP